MKSLFLSFALTAGLALTACGNGQTATNKSPEPTTSEAPLDTPEKSRVALKKITDGVWLHTSFQDIPGYGIVPANGLAVQDGQSLILVNTAWGEMATAELIDKLKTETGLDVTKLVVIHFHPDSLAGVDWLEERGVEVYAHPDTPGLSTLRGTPIPNTSVPELAEPGSRVSVGPLEISYPGPAHTEDNLMVWVKDPQLLFGGCAVRAAHHKTLGNVVDADLTKWPDSLKWAKETYGDARMVVPSHGNPAGLELLEHTLKLLEEQAK